MQRVLFHMDSDGHASAGVVLHYLLGKGVKQEEICFHPINYGMDLPTGINYEKDTVFLVDFSLQPTENLISVANSLGDRFIWIDHHDTSIDAENENPSLRRVRGIRQSIVDDGTKISACELTWIYFFCMEPIPRIISLIGDWDTWRWKQLPQRRQTEVSELQYALKMEHTDPSTDPGFAFWVRHLHGPGAATAGSSLTSNGKACLAYQRKQWHNAMKGDSFEADFQELKAIMINQTGGSEMFNEFFDPDKHDVMITFKLIRGEFVVVSLYRPDDKIHLGRLARKLGEAGSMKSGGGHAGAAGFQCSWDYFKTLYKRQGE